MDLFFTLLPRFCNTIENLESRCEELTKQIDELNQIIVIERRKKERLVQENKQLTEASGEKKAERVQLRSIKNEGGQRLDTVDGTGDNTSGYGFKSPNSSGTMSSSGEEDDVLRQQNDALDKLQHELEMTRKEWLAEQQRVSELEEQLIAISELLNEWRVNWRRRRSAANPTIIEWFN